MFQSTLPRGERRFCIKPGLLPGHVSIHAPAWGATENYGKAYSIFNSFNPRSRVGSDDIFLVLFPPFHCFNPRSRVGSDFPKCFKGGSQAVSIHAPAWGATSPGANPSSTMDVSIHAPAWGATFPARCSYYLNSCFNPRSRVGSDFDEPIGTAQAVDVSIHAPAWGATFGREQQLDKLRVSIHAPAWGATCKPGNGRTRTVSFNPRSRVGSDPFPLHVVPRFSMFQSTLPRGERPQKIRGRGALTAFQSTLPRGERRRLTTGDRGELCFNPRSRVGSD